MRGINDVLTAVEKVLKKEEKRALSVDKIIKRPGGGGLFLETIFDKSLAGQVGDTTTRSKENNNMAFFFYGSPAHGSASPA